MLGAKPLDNENRKVDIDEKLSSDTDQETSSFINNNKDIDTKNNISYDYYKEISSLDKLSPICMSDEFEVGYNSFYSIISSFRVLILLILMTVYDVRLDRFFNHKYMKYHAKFYSIQLIVFVISNISVFIIPLVQRITLLTTVIIYGIGYFCWYIFLTLYFKYINIMIIKKWGKSITLRMFELYFVFSAQILKIGWFFLIITTQNSYYLSYIPSIYTSITGVIIFLIGFFFRITGIYAIGFNTYYWYDMVLEIPNSYFATNSIYKYVSNPIYGPGYLMTYGSAIFYKSIVGVLCSILMHCGIYTFYILAEKPFIEKMYLSTN